jgi:hypothetical protein
MDGGCERKTWAEDARTEMNRLTNVRQIPMSETMNIRLDTALDVVTRSREGCDNDPKQRHSGLLSFRCCNEHPDRSIEIE